MRNGWSYIQCNCFKWSLFFHSHSLPFARSYKSLEFFRENHSHFLLLNVCYIFFIIIKSVTAVWSAFHFFFFFFAISCHIMFHLCWFMPILFLYLSFIMGSGRDGDNQMTNWPSLLNEWWRSHWLKNSLNSGSSARSSHSWFSRDSFSHYISYN